MFVILAILGYTLLGVVALLDKFILSKKVSSSLTYVFYTAAPFVLLFLAIPFGIQWPTNIYSWLAALGGGLFFWAGLGLMFAGMKRSEVSHVGPLVGASVSLCTLILSRFILGEIVPVNKMWGIGFLIVGSLLISIEKSKKHNGIHLGMLWGVLSGLFFSASYVASKFIYNDLGFVSGLVWSKGILGLCGILLLLLPMVRSEVWRKNVSVKRSNQNIIFANLGLSVIGVFLIQYALSIGVVSIVSAFEGLKFAILIILVALLSKFFPKILKEEYAKGEMRQEILAVSLIGLGLFLLI